jgi:hypothetical protein
MKNSIKYLNSFFAAMILKLLLFGALTFGLNAYGQDFVAASSEQSNILYRGYDNKLTLGEVGCANQEYEIVPIDCKIKKVNSDGSERSYIVRPTGRLKIATIKFVSADGNPLETVVFTVKNLPNPLLYWGNNEFGSTVSSSPKLFVKYSSDVRLNTSFEIVSWEFNHKYKNFSGAGDELSSKILEYTRSMPLGETISIITKVKGPDGIEHTMGGTWTKR